ncbi:YbaN family protein [Pseudoalteromonas sp. Of11M-6]|uniref:YbaN family protein n=1 Tax=Pseudoalteromonas sp. Of11M-6 TaxID=2917754 RepID=UPI001EF66621|nr:YbaN family protein [Pseudoalteromonas sp. Of11M-6]MCG7553515.1 YbaN family protein [Pseudoalteromonas sp. Of11M-6]
MKIIYDLVGIVFCILALIFFVVPGPSVIFLLAALVCFSMNHEGAKKHLKNMQRLFKLGCEKLDRTFQK